MLKFGVMAHEIAHALGLLHEQTRHDRDDFITIDDQNIEERAIEQYEKVTNWKKNDLL